MASADSFDPYHKWLGIPPVEQPPNYYRLLGLAVFEADADVIDSAADQRMHHVRSFQTGQHSDLSQKLLNELTTARLTLLNGERKERYDRFLKAELEGKAPTGSPESGAPPRPAPPTQQAVKPSVSAKPAKWKHEPAGAKGPPPTIASLAAEALAKANESRLSRAPRRTPKPHIAWWVAAWSVGLVAVFLVSHFDWLDPRSTQELAQRQERELAAARINAALLAKADKSRDKAGSDAALQQTPLSTPANVTTSASSPTASALSENPLQTSLPPPTPTVEPHLVESPVSASNPNSPPSNTTTPEPTDTAALQDFTSVERLFTESPATQAITAAARHPVPEAATLERAEAQFKDVFKADLARAKTPQEQIELARRLRQVADESQSQADMWYVLTLHALDLATKNCEPNLALQWSIELADKFELDRGEIVTKTVTQLGRAAKSTDQRTAVTWLAVGLANLALRSGRLDRAIELATTATSVSSGGKDADSRDAARETLDRARRRERQATELAAAEQKLAAKPDDQTAQGVVGRRLAFVDHRWSTGLEHLAASGDSLFAALAQRDLQENENPTDAYDLAGAWWEAGEKAAEHGDEQALRGARVRAAHWYRKAAPQLTGIQLVNAQKRMASGDPIGAGLVLAWWRFEEGQPGMVRPVDLKQPISGDSSDNGNLLWLADTAAPAGGRAALYATTAANGHKVPLTGDDNLVAYDFHSRPDEFARRELIVRHTGGGADLARQGPAKWTVELSANVSDVSIAQDFLQCDAVAAGGMSTTVFSIQLASDGRLVVAARAADGTQHNVISSDRAAAHHWFHAAVVADGQTLKLYVDGADGVGYRLQGSGPFVGSLGAATPDGSTTWLIGHGAPPLGLIDEIRISQVALDPGQFLFDGPIGPRKK